MSFKGYNGALRKIGRKIVLPVEKIKSILNIELFDKENTLSICVDFGSGTLFWAEWLQSKGVDTYAVDIIYNESKINNGIKCIDSMEKIDMPRAYLNGIFFASDVFHHLDNSFEAELLQKITGSPYLFKYIVIKDINCNRHFGNIMNRMHDKIINGENIRDVDPGKLIAFFEENGYECKFYEMRKLWYPHFLIIAKRKNYDNN